MYGARTCNGECMYCCSRASNNINKEKDDIKIDDEALLKAIKNHTKKSIDVFQIWGTEPLLHLNEFKHLVDLLEKNYPNSRIQSSSNGILLCDENIKNYLIKHNIRMQLSHDGPSQYLRTPHFDPAYNENVIELARRGMLFVNCVTNEKNKDIKKVIEYWDNWREYSKADINIRINIPMYGDNGEFELTNPKEYFDELDKYYDNRYMWHLRELSNKYKKTNGMRSCRKFSRGLCFKSNQIDTLGKYTKCNLLDSSQEPSNPKGLKPLYCLKCEYRDSSVCNDCNSLKYPKKCNYLYELNKWLESKTNRE